MVNLKSARFSGIVDFEQIILNGKRLRRGAKGLAVRKIQQALMDLGFSLPGFVPDGVYESQTLQMVRKFQKANHLKPDGIIGSSTIQALDEVFLKNLKDTEILQAIRTTIVKKGARWIAGETLMTHLPLAEKRKYTGSND